jgi:hypothetical protein
MPSEESAIVEAVQRRRKMIGSGRSGRGGVSLASHTLGRTFGGCASCVYLELGLARAQWYSNAKQHQRRGDEVFQILNIASHTAHEVALPLIVGLVWQARLKEVECGRQGAAGAGCQMLRPGTRYLLSGQEPASAVLVMRH